MEIQLGNVLFIALKIHLWCKSIVKTIITNQSINQSKLSIIFKELSYCSLCTLDTIYRLFFVTRLIINKINKVQWVDFKLENVLVSRHSLKIMGFGPFGALAPLFLRNAELLGHSPIHKGHLLMNNSNRWWSAVGLIGV